DQLLQGGAVLQLLVQGAEEVLGGRLLDDAGEALEVVGGLDLVFLVVLGGETEFGGEAGADEHGQHASADVLEEFTTMRVRHETPPGGSEWRENERDACYPYFVDQARRGGHRSGARRLFL